MPTIIYSPGAQLTQIDVPEKEVQEKDRSVKGALFIRPGATVQVTDAEAAFLKKQGVPYVVAGTQGKRKKGDEQPSQPAEPKPVPGVAEGEGGQPDGGTEQEMGEADTLRAEEQAGEYKPYKPQ